MSLLTKGYFVFIITSSITLLGFWLYEWNLSGILFYIFLLQIPKLPNTIMTYAKLKNGELKSVLGFSVVQILVIGFYSIFMVFLVNNSSRADVLGYIPFNEMYFEKTAFRQHLLEITSYLHYLCMS